MITFEQAVEHTVETLTRAADLVVRDPVQGEALVAVADGWTRLAIMLRPRPQG